MKIKIDSKLIPMLATLGVLLLLYAVASFMYEGFFSLRVFANLFYDNAFLGITALGMTFVILSGGIDLSVGSVLGFTTVFVATMIDKGMDPVVVWILAVVLSTTFGAAMGSLIHFFEMPPFLVTLGGMFFARGMAFVVNTQSVGISSDLYEAILGFAIPFDKTWIPGVPLFEAILGFAIPFGKTWIPAVSLFFVAMFAFCLYLAHFTRFGRNVYAVGGDENSALLMGLPVARTKILVYAFSGFCSGLAGIVATFYIYSGNPRHGIALELDAIAAVVIGGTLLTGGVGYVSGTLLGVLIFGVIDSALKFDGRLDSYWLRIVLGMLLLLFILLQKYIARRTRNLETADA